MSPTASGPEQEAYWTAVLNADEPAALEVAAGLLERGVPYATVLQDLVVATQLRIGQQWATNTCTVASEHAATAVSEVVVRRLAERIPEPEGGGLVLVGCAEREWHALPALVVAQSLRSWGQRTLFLGPSTSRDQLVSRILDLGPRAVLLSASLTSSLPRVRRQIEAVRGTGTAVLVGGSAFDRTGLRAQRLGATGFATTAEEALTLLDTLPRHVTTAPPLRHPGAVEARNLIANSETVGRALLTATDTRLGLSGGGEAAVPPDDWRVVLATFVPHVIDCVAGALLTEDASLVVDCRVWLADVLTARAGDPTASDVLWGSLQDLLHDYPVAIGMLGQS